MPRDACVTSEHVASLVRDLQGVKEFWENRPQIGGVLLSAYYRQIVAKTNRIKSLLTNNAKEDLFEATRGARFSEDNKHIITYFVEPSAIDSTISRLIACRKFIEEQYPNGVDKSDFENLTKTRGFRLGSIPKNEVLQIIRDVWFVEKFKVDNKSDLREGESIVSLYRTNVKPKDFLARLQITLNESNFLDDYTVLMTAPEINRLKNLAPYLISMEVTDFREFKFDSAEARRHVLDFPEPSGEPIIGVIDTVFNEGVYFHQWVQYENKLNAELNIDIKNVKHGTEVTSIIVDGPGLNPDLEDGCGRFRVKHFGVAADGRASAFSILKTIREAVSENPQIKVWNLSLGSAEEISENYISPEAAELDRIQSEYDVVFVVSGTNNRREDKSIQIRIGAPADSLNSIVVNSVTRSQESASYTRYGPVLKFFLKPDVSYYGGDAQKGDFIRTLNGQGASLETGTSFAAPWIARKLAYLIYVMGFSRQMAKALIIDSAAQWKKMDRQCLARGYGVVPTHIRDILKSRDDEIRFVISGTLDDYETYSYDIPVPVDNDAYPYLARATLCYFPNCSREQGVDYTSTEVDLQFGRVRQKNDGFKVESVNGNRQDHEDFYTKEEIARRFFRKWDNVKVISDVLVGRSRPRKKYAEGKWGLSLKVKERLSKKNGHGMPFAVVITLREMYGVNRYQDFIKACSLSGWLVNEIDVDNRVNIYEKADEEITLFT